MRSAILSNMQKVVSKCLYETCIRTNGVDDFEEVGFVGDVNANAKIGLFAFYSLEKGSCGRIRVARYTFAVGQA